MKNLLFAVIAVMGFAGFFACGSDGHGNGHDGETHEHSDDAEHEHGNDDHQH